MKYLVTGGAGFIGSHLCDRLTADGHEVVVLDDLSTGRIDNIEHLIRSQRIEFVEGSTTDEDLVIGVLDSVDACVHLASMVGVSLVVDRPVDTLLSNIRGTDIVLSAAAGLRKRTLFASTSEIYGKHTTAHSTRTPTRLEDRMVGAHRRREIEEHGREEARAPARGLDDPQRLLGLKGWSSNPSAWGVRRAGPKSERGAAGPAHRIVPALPCLRRAPPFGEGRLRSRRRAQLVRIRQLVHPPLSAVALEPAHEALAAGAVEEQVQRSRSARSTRPPAPP